MCGEAYNTDKQKKWVVSKHDFEKLTDIFCFHNMNTAFSKILQKSHLYVTSNRVSSDFSRRDISINKIRLRL